MTTKKSTTTRKTTTAKKSPGKKKVTADAIRHTAREIYLERINTGRPGDELSDWLEAEKKLNGVQ